ncbi:cell division protein FtsB [Aureibacter tunicatorum]|uniref:Cell division protein FtsB n=2 Tax=Aureibacter tunicatorum TaxID=866807 RepID=A0AAE3XJF7_9BACT|nr:cell division protein FtsB [Aureibacter tunicatorum]
MASLIFAVWMLFFDSNDLISQFKLRRKLSQLSGQREYFLKEIEKIKKDREELMNNKELLEKFARERYLMKKDGEDIYIIEYED